jgi:PleD family two-component response regulator
MRLGKAQAKAGTPPQPAMTLCWRCVANLPDRILVAEDEPLSREVATSLLESAGLVPVLAENGVEAVALVAAATAMRWLMDVQMPGMNGLDATRAIRAAAGHGDAPDHRHDRQCLRRRQASLPGAPA